MTTKKPTQKKQAEAIDTVPRQALTIQGNLSIGTIQWDATAVEAIQTMAEGLLENAKGLHTLAQVLRATDTSLTTKFSLNECLLAFISKDAAK